MEPKIAISCVNCENSIVSSCFRENQFYICSHCKEENIIIIMGKKDYQIKFSNKDKVLISVITPT